MSKISEENKIIARTAANAFGGPPQVTTYWDDDHKSRVDILTCSDRPQDGVASFSTIGLSDAPLLLDDREYEARLEIVGACGDAFQGFDRALATSAFCIINSKWFCFPGAIFPDVLSMYNCSSTMRHFFFEPPFIWEETLKTLNFDTKKVARLLAVPISDAEKSYAETEGPERLQDLFDEHQIDIFDLERPSVL